MTRADVERELAATLARLNALGVRLARLHTAPTTPWPSPRPSSPPWRSPPEHPLALRQPIHHPRRSPHVGVDPRADRRGEPDLAKASSYAERQDAAERLDTLNAQLLAAAFAQRDAQAAAQLAPALGGIADRDTRSPAERLGLA